MITETYFIVKVEKVTCGVREQNEFTRLFDSEHPRMKEPNPPEQYGYKTIVETFTDKANVLEQRVDTVDVERILKAVNKGL